MCKNGRSPHAHRAIMVAPPPHTPPPPPLTRPPTNGHKHHTQTNVYHHHHHHPTQPRRRATPKPHPQIQNMDIYGCGVKYSADRMGAYGYPSRLRGTPYGHVCVVRLMAQLMVMHTCMVFLRRHRIGASASNAYNYRCLYCVIARRRAHDVVTLTILARPGAPRPRRTLFKTEYKTQSPSACPIISKPARRVSICDARRVDAHTTKTGTHMNCSTCVF